MITVTLPFPPAALSPNSRKGWRAKAAAVQQYRYDCRIEALKQWREEWLASGIPQMHSLKRPVYGTLTFILKGKRRHDWDNLLASFKAGIDGIVDAGLLPDDDVRSWSPTLRYEQGDKPAVRVELVSA